MAVSDPDLPVLRLRKRLLRTDLVALYESHLLVGILRKRHVTLTEEMCHPAGEAALTSRLSHVRRIELASVTAVREVRGLSTSRITVEAQGRGKVHFSLPAAQLDTLRAALAARLGQRAQLAPPASSPAAGTKAAAKRRTPAYSRWRGWLLKILGALYWIAIASPLTDRIPTSGENRYLWLLLWLPAPLLISQGYRLCQRRYEPERRHDSRKPFLFLRPFADDAATTLQPLGLLAELTGVRLHASGAWANAAEGGRVAAKDLLLISHPVRLLRMFFDYGASSSEEALVRFFESYGPVVAIGRPGEATPNPGSERIYVADGAWQEAVLSELQNAQAIILQPGVTTGICWELDQVRQHAEPWRVLLCLVTFWQDPQAYERWRALVKADLGWDLPRVVPYLDRPAFLYFERDWVPRLQPLSYRCPVLWPLTADAADLRYSLQPFMEGMFGGDREPPRPPRWVGGMSTFAAACAATALALVVVLLPVLGVHWLTRAAFGSPAAETGGEREDELQIPRVVEAAPLTVLRGSAVPYHLVIPEALVPAPPMNKFMEHERRSPDKLFVLEVGATHDSVDYSDLARVRLAAFRQQGFAASLESVRTVRQGGADWLEVRSAIHLGSGRGEAVEIARAASGPRGSVVLILTLARLAGPEAIYLKVADRILQSFGFDS